jgi:starch synthase
MRYGAVPVVRATGGLRDSVLDVDQTPEGTGFVFAAVAPEDLRAAIHRALGVFEDKRRWRSIQQLGMKRDHSWERTAVAYAELYALRIHEAI